MELAVKAPPEEGGTCRRAGAQSRGGTRRGLGRGARWGLEPLPQPASSPGCTRLLHEVMVPQGALVRELCGVRVIWSGHQGCVYRAPGPRQTLGGQQRSPTPVESVPLRLGPNPCCDLAPISGMWSDCFLSLLLSRVKLQRTENRCEQEGPRDSPLG